MTWPFFSILTIFLYGVHDIFIKRLASEVDPLVASGIINLCASIGMCSIILVNHFIFKNSVPVKIGNKNIFGLILAGFSLGLATVTFMKSFSTGGSFAVVIPIIYIGIILMSALLGIFLFKESLTLSQIFGMVFSLVGLVLIFKK